MKIGRNELCPCGSGKKYKHCCIDVNSSDIRSIVDYSKGFNEVESDFIRRGIDVTTPGFYDDPNFMDFEKIYPEYLNNYARFVQTREYTTEYLSKAEKEIPFISKLLSNELIKDGRLGACIDTSMVLSRILEIEGYWNYLVKGALTLNFSPDLGISDKHFWPVDITSSSAGHAWITAPPFGVIDVTLRQQPYYEGEEEYIPEYIIEKPTVPATVKTEDIFSDEARHYYSKKYNGKSDELIRLELPHVEKAIGVFQPYLIDREFLEMKYITVAISASDGSLSEMKNLYLNGLSGYEIYCDIIKPALEVFRKS